MQEHCFFLFFFFSRQSCCFAEVLRKPYVEIMFRKENLHLMSKAKKSVVWSNPSKLANASNQKEILSKIHYAR